MKAFAPRPSGSTNGIGVWSVAAGVTRARQSPVIKKWLLTLALLLAVTDLDGTLTKGNTICVPFYCPYPYADSIEMLEQFDEVLYLSCKVSFLSPTQNWWLEAYEFPEGESWAIGNFSQWLKNGDGCPSYNNKCDFLKEYQARTGTKFTHGISEDDQSWKAYECAGIPNIIKVVH